ncbi:MAG: hypothetical protein ACM3W4_02060 [Ignavibacteriales bacterium]
MSYISGSSYFICDRCGFKRRDKRKEWTGLVVCEPCLDPRPPELDPPNVYPEGLPLPDARPEPEDTDVGDVTPDDL